MEPKITIAGSVRSQIDTFKEGYVFSYLEFEDATENADAIIKALNRFEIKGIICKLIKGKYYKPYTTNKKNSESIKETIKDLLVKNGEIIGYCTGLDELHKNTLPVYMPNTIVIGRNTFKPPLKRGNYTIKFLLQKHVITKENTEMLLILDCLKMLKDYSVDAKRDSLKTIAKFIRKHNKLQKEILIKLSLKYPSSTRDLLRYVFEQEKFNGPLALIEEFRNPISSFNTGLKDIDKFLRDKYNGK
jgi:hypothetical protein